jgi:hypothetical protein
VIDPYFDPYPGELELAPAQWTRQYHRIQGNVSTYERLDNENCIKAYSQKLIPEPSNVILVTSAQNSTNSIFALTVRRLTLLAVLTLHTGSVLKIPHQRV